ncbi:MAG TPA: hypothetical protein VGN75_02020, partial [Kaistia sp.]|nr:hypothetical protein [Kaistia sp.]
PVDESDWDDWAPLLLVVALEPPEPSPSSPWPMAGAASNRIAARAANRDACPTIWANESFCRNMM